MRHLFYAPDLAAYQTVALPAEEAQHAAKVLRMREGDEILLTNGKGLKAQGTILGLTRQQCVVQVQEAEQVPPAPARLTLCVAPPKNIKRFEWLLEKATEVGVHSIVPFVSRYSERKDLKAERLQKLVLSAMKQSLKVYLPTLEPLHTFDSLLQRPFGGNKLIAWCKAEDSQWMDTHLAPNTHALIMVGPEGGFSQEEYERAVAHHYMPLKISTSRLRTETAALTVCQQMAFINKY